MVSFNFQNVVEKKQIFFKLINFNRNEKCRKIKKYSVFKIKTANKIVKIEVLPLKKYSISCSCNLKNCNFYELFKAKNVYKNVFFIYSLFIYKNLVVVRSKKYVNIDLLAPQKANSHEFLGLLTSMNLKQIENESIKGENVDLLDQTDHVLTSSSSARVNKPQLQVYRDSQRTFKMQKQIVLTKKFNTLTVLFWKYSPDMHLYGSTHPGENTDHV